MTAAPSAWTCACVERAPRNRQYADGRPATVLQCLRCGRQYGGAIKWQPSAPAFDAALAEAFEAECRQRRLDQQITEREARRAEYERYLASPEWQARRALVLARDRGKCQACLVAPAAEVHHLTYVRFGREDQFEPELGRV